MKYPVIYLEWSEPEQRVLRTVADTEAAQGDLFVRKLVNATLFRNGLYEHSANECEEGLRHHIYAKRYREDDDPLYGHAIRTALQECCTVSEFMEAEFLLWNGIRFHPCSLRRLAPAAPLEFAQLLLDHYIVTEGHTYETVYTVYDMDRSKIVIFLKEVNA